MLNIHDELPESLIGFAYEVVELVPLGCLINGFSPEQFMQETEQRVA